MIVLGFAASAALATLARAVVTSDQARGAIPWRTLSVNTTGAFLLGLVLSSALWNHSVIVTTAGLGSFTTFSTVVAETIALVLDRRLMHAIAYVGLTLVVGIAAAWLGLSIGEHL